MSEETRIVKGKCYATAWCPHCDHRLNQKEYMYSRGACPYCGHCAGGTVSDYYKRTYRIVRHQEKVWFWWRTVKTEHELMGTFDKLGERIVREESS